MELNLTIIKYIRESREDAQRTWMTKEELCGFLWNFRFKKATGPGWVEDDPWWLGKPPRQVRFLEDGLVKWESDGGDTSIYECTRIGYRLRSSQQRMACSLGTQLAVASSLQ